MCPKCYIFCPCPVCGGTFGGTVRISFLTILTFILLTTFSFAKDICTDAATTGAKTAVGVADLNSAHWDCDILLSGTVTAASVRIEGNQGGSVFDPAGMATHTCTAAQLAAGICSFSMDGIGANNMRCNVLTLTGTSPKISKVQCNGRPK